MIEDEMPYGLLMLAGLYAACLAYKINLGWGFTPVAFSSLSINAAIFLYIVSRA